MYSFLEPSENVGIPEPQKNAGLYAGDTPYKKTQWSKDYRGPRIEPDAVAFSTQFYEGARNHIPTGIRPGNNTILKNPYNYVSTTYNTMCYLP